MMLLMIDPDSTTMAEYMLPVSDDEANTQQHNEEHKGIYHFLIKTK